MLFLQPIEYTDLIISIVASIIIEFVLTNTLYKYISDFIFTLKQKRSVIKNEKSVDNKTEKIINEIKQTEVINKPLFDLNQTTQVSDNTQYTSEAINWIVYINFKSNTKVNIENTFDKGWLTRFNNPRILAGQNNKFVPVENINEYDSLIFSFRLWNLNSLGKKIPIDKQVIAYAMVSIEEKLKKNNFDFNISASSNFEVAEGKSNSLIQLFNNYAKSVEFKIIKSDSSLLVGKDIAKVLQANGFVWGQDGIFYYQQNNITLFRVYTSTAPGKFLPQDIAQNALFRDLIFSFDYWLFDDPAKVFAGIFYIAQIINSQITNSKIVDLQNTELSLEIYSNKITQVINQLRSSNLNPGSAEIIELFK